MESMFPAVMPKRDSARQGRERLGAEPVRLADHPDAEALGLEARPTMATRSWVVDIGIARDEDDVAGVPAEDVISSRDMGRKGAG